MLLSILQSPSSVLREVSTEKYQCSYPNSPRYPTRPAVCLITYHQSNEAKNGQTHELQAM